LLCQRFKKKSKPLFLKTDGAGNLSFSSDLPTTSFTGATVETSIADSDLVLIYDDSATAVRKMTKANLVSGIGASAGQVIQVVTATDSTQRSTTSSSFVTASNTLSVSITPSNTANKVFIIVGAPVRGDYTGYLTVYRGATDLGASSSKGLCTFLTEVGVAAGSFGCGVSYLDSPSTTSSTTYEVRFRTTGGTAYLNFDNCKSSITLMEIKG